MDLAVRAACPLAGRLDCHQLRELPLRLVAMAEAEQIASLSKVLPRRELAVHADPPVVAKPLDHDPLKRKRQRLVVVPVDDQRVHRCHACRRIDEGDHGIGAVVEHLGQPAIPFQRRALGRGASRRIVVVDVAERGHRQPAGLVPGRHVEQLRRRLAQHPGRDVQVVVGAGRPPPGGFAEVRVRHHEYRPPVARLHGPGTRHDRLADASPRRLDHRLDALADGRPRLRLQPDEHTKQFRDDRLAGAPVDAGAFPLCRLGRRHLVAGHVGLNVVQQVLDRPDRPAGRASLHRVAVGACLDLHLLRVGGRRWVGQRFEHAGGQSFLASHSRSPSWPHTGMPSSSHRAFSVLASVLPATRKAPD